MRHLVTVERLLWELDEVVVAMLIAKLKLYLQEQEICSFFSVPPCHFTTSILSTTACSSFALLLFVDGF
jgi:hypothetical protein